MFGNPSWTNPFDQPAGAAGGFGGASTVAPAQLAQPGGPGAPDAIWGHPNSLPPEPSFQAPPEMPRQMPGDMAGPMGLWGNQGNQASSQPNLYQRQFDFQGAQPQDQGFQGQFQGGPAAQVSTQPPTQAPTQARIEAFEPPRMGQTQQGNPYQPVFVQPSHQMAQPVQPYGNQPTNQAMPGNQMQQLPPQGNLYGQAPVFNQQPPMPGPDGQAPTGDGRLCTCGQPALLLNVKKEGPNQGRQFFKCARQHPEVPCSFFEWADEPPRGAAAAPAPGMPQLPPGPPCHCGQPTLSLTVKKDGPNQGRLFHKCGMQQCQFFQWADQEPDPLGPPCPCGVPSLRKTVSKDGPNKGRPFLVCARRSCNYFAWADEEAGAGPGGPAGPAGPTPTPARAGGMQRSRDGDVCFHCNQPGHWSSSCPNKASAPKGRGKGRGRGRGRGRKAASEDDFGGFDDRFMPY